VKWQCGVSNVSNQYQLKVIRKYVSYHECQYRLYSYGVMWQPAWRWRSAAAESQLAQWRTMQWLMAMYGSQ